MSCPACDEESIEDDYCDHCLASRAVATHADDLHSAIGGARRCIRMTRSYRKDVASGHFLSEAWKEEIKYNLIHLGHYRRDAKNARRRLRAAREILVSYEREEAAE